MKLLKHLGLLLLPLFWAANGFGQQVSPDSLQVHIDAAKTKYDWQLVTNNPTSKDKGCFGCASFYWRIMRTKTPDATGKYSFYLFLTSNSFTNDGTLTSTYLKRATINLVQVGKAVPYADPFSMLIPPKSKTFNGMQLGGMCRSKKPDQPILLKWETYSIY